MGPHLMTSVPVRVKFGNRDRGHPRRMPCDNRGRDWGDASTCRGMPRIASNSQKLGRGKEGASSPWSLQREYGLVNAGIVDFWPRLQGNKFQLFYSPRWVAICYSSSRKHRHHPSCSGFISLSTPAGIIGEDGSPALQSQRLKIKY